MSETDDLLKALSDFMKGKSGTPQTDMAILSSQGAEPPSFPELPKLSATFGEMAKEYPNVVNGLSHCSLEQTAASIGGLLTLPDLQANCLRLEALAHMAAQFSKGKNRPTAGHISAWFNQLDRGTCGSLEDPAENLFIGNVSDSFGNYRLFEGTSEGNAFHTQVLLDVLNEMPATGVYARLRASVHGILIISEILAVRCGLPRNIVGVPNPRSKIPSLKENLFFKLKQRVVFSLEEVSRLGISITDIAPFLLDLPQTNILENTIYGHSPLEASPLILSKDSLIVALPSAIGLAVRRLIIETCIQENLTGSFERALAETYSALFRSERLLGELSDVPIHFASSQHTYYSQVHVEIDEGRHLHLLVFCDNLSDYAQGTFAGHNKYEPMTEYVAAEVERARNELRKLPDFREAITLIVGCAWGRSLALKLPEDEPNCRVEFLSAYDLMTLSRDVDFKLLDLFRVLDARDRMEEQEISIVYANGLLNLYSWMKASDGHIVPHERLESDFVSEGQPSFLSIPQNALLDVRNEVANTTDMHRVKTPEGRYTLVRRVNAKPRYGSASLSPFYADIDAFKNKEVKAVYETNIIDLWVQVFVSPKLEADITTNLRLMALNWAECVAREMSSHLRGKVAEPFSWVITFSDDSHPLYGEHIPDRAEIAQLVKIEYEHTSRLARITVDKGFLLASRRPDNAGERAIVRSLVEALISSVGENLNEQNIDHLTSKIVVDDGARHFHAFSVLDVRDHVRPLRSTNAQIIERMDDANNRIGLGWLVRKRREGGKIEGKAECCQYLNDLTKAIAERIQTLLRNYNRHATIDALLLNHELAAIEAKRWQRTFRAIRALSLDESKAAQEAGLKIAGLNAASLSSRILIEIAICECPLEGGTKPGSYDLASLLANASMLFHLGGYSDAVASGVMPATIRVSPAGDVLMDHGFTDRIVRPFGEKFQFVTLSDAAGHYHENYLEVDSAADSAGEISSTINRDFEGAWLDEFKFSLADTKNFVEAFRVLAVEIGQPTITMKRAELIGLLNARFDLASDTAERLLNTFSLSHRPKWDVSPDGLMRSAWYPWRFRRQLSLVTRPILSLKNDTDTSLLIAPAMVVHHISKFVSDVMLGLLDVEMFRVGGAISKWIGSTNKEQGEAFNERAAERFRELGWQARANLSDGEILNRAKDPAFGDVDVLAWRADTGRVLIIECKDLSLDKTFGEIARRLEKYRGATDASQKRDEMRRHLDRCEILKSEQASLSNFIGSSVNQTEAILLFSNPAPLQFDEAIKDLGVTTIAFNEIDEFLGIS